MNKGFLSAAIVLGLTSVSYADRQFDDVVASVLEISREIRALPSQNHPGYSGLIQECRWHLNASMILAAESGNWRTLKKKIPGPEICSYTGKVLPKTKEAYRLQMSEAASIAESQ